MLSVDRHESVHVRSDVAEEVVNDIAVVQLHDHLVRAEYSFPSSHHRVVVVASVPFLGFGRENIGVNSTLLQDRGVCTQRHFVLHA